MSASTNLDMISMNFDTMARNVEDARYISPGTTEAITEAVFNHIFQFMRHPEMRKRVIGDRDYGGSGLRDGVVLATGNIPDPINPLLHTNYQRRYPKRQRREAPAASRAGPSAIEQRHGWNFNV